MHPRAYAIVTLFCNPAFKRISGQGSIHSALDLAFLIASPKSDATSNARQAFLCVLAFAVFVISPPCRWQVGLFLRP